MTFREATIEEPSAARLLDEYFASRAAGFPAELGEYRVNRPNADDFVPPRGVFLIVEGETIEGEPGDVGCGGIRLLESPSDAVRYEVKHIWLEPHTRGQRIGRALLDELERRARAFGAQELVLDTNASLHAANALYRSAGYESIPPYNDNPNATNWFLKRL
ncbi:GNAT family N-acetyltransferase [Ruicaihuangia caeni]|uniref:GNAT family N-acetyltransferase n=1 Tax=Ruicaihuangia caeni TaxID=3042517 RepID=UPI0030ECCD11